MKDLIITWPKKRKLDSYVEELAKAADCGKVISFRVPTVPKIKCERCYVVHDGRVRGWTRVLKEEHRGEGEVQDPITGMYWPAGNYIIRMPKWHPLTAGPWMKGFQGFRYIDRLCKVCEGNKTIWVSWESRPVQCGHCHGTGIA